MTEKHTRDKATVERALSKHISDLLTEKLLPLLEEDGLSRESIRDQIDELLGHVIDIGPERMTVIEAYLSCFDNPNEHDKEDQLSRLADFLELIRGNILDE
jgi:hypothetical protein